MGLFLFDLDDTLTPKGQEFEPTQKEKFIELFKGIKSAGNKISLLSTTGKRNALNQLGDMIQFFDYIMVENGLVSMKVTDGQITDIENILFKDLCEPSSTGEVCKPDKMKEMIEFARAYMKALFGLELDETDTSALGADKPEATLKDMYEKYRDELVQGLINFSEENDKSKQILWKVAQINFSPIGTTKDRSVYAGAREDFKEINNPAGQKHVILGPFRDVLEKRFGGVDFSQNNNKIFLEFNIGGSTGVDIFPKGWNKTYGYYFMKKLTSGGKVIDITKATPEPGHPIEDDFKHVLFFGDQALSKVGNDYEVCKAMQNVDSDLCVPVKDPSDTIQKLEQILSEGVSKYIESHKKEFQGDFSKATSQSGGSKRKTKKSRRHTKKSRGKSRKTRRNTKKSKGKSRKLKSKSRKIKRKVRKSKMNLDRVSHGAYMTSDFKV